MIYNIRVTENGWEKSFSTGSYSEFFDEAVKVLHAELPEAVEPAMVTVLPAMEHGDINYLRINHIVLHCWDFEAKGESEC